MDKKITLVLNRTPIVDDASDLAGAEALFGQKVVYQHHIDITDDILDALDKSEGEVPPPFSPAPFELPEPVILKQEVNK